MVEESYSDEGISAEQAALNRKRKEAKKAKNQKRRARKKQKKQLAKNNACARCGTTFCDGCVHGDDCPRHPMLGCLACNCRVCRSCFVRNFVGNASRSDGRWSVACPGGCGFVYAVDDTTAHYCWRSISDLAEAAMN